MQKHSRHPSLSLNLNLSSFAWILGKNIFQVYMCSKENISKYLVFWLPISTRYLKKIMGDDVLRSHNEKKKSVVIIWPKPCLKAICMTSNHNLSFFFFSVIGTVSGSELQAPRFITQPSASGSIVAEGRTKILQCQALGKSSFVFLNFPPKKLVLG